SDLTVDCNYPTNLQSSTYGCIIGGTHCAIRRVQVINGAGVGPSAEAFGLEISGWTGSNCPSDGNIIEECEFSQFKGGTCSAIAMTGCSSVDNSVRGIIRNNRIYMNLANTGVAINAGDAGNLLVEGNFTYSAPTGFYGDTDSYDTSWFRTTPLSI